VPITASELNYDCSRCGVILSTENVKFNPPPPVITQKKDDMSYWKRPYKKMTKGVRNRSSVKGPHG